MTKRSRGDREPSHEPQRKQFVQDRLKGNGVFMQPVSYLSEMNSLQSAVDPFTKMFHAARAQAQANNTTPKNSGTNDVT